MTNKEPWTKIAERNDFAVNVAQSRVCKSPSDIFDKLPARGTATFEYVNGLLYIRFDLHEED